MIIIADRLTQQLRATHDPTSAPVTVAEQLAANRDNQTTVEAYIYDGATPVDDAAGFTFAIGLEDYSPSDSFTITYGAAETAEIQTEYISATAIQNALCDLSTIAADGGVDVEIYDTGGPSLAWVATWRTVGAPSESFSFDTEQIKPHSTLIATSIRTGDASTRQQYLFELAPDALATASSWAAKASPTIAGASELTGDADTQAIQTLTITGAFDAGEYMEVDADGTNKFTIVMGASAGAMKTALNAELGAGSVDVTKPRDGLWRIEWQANGAQTTVAATLAASARSGSTANLSFDNTQVALALAGKSAVRANAWLKLGNEVVYSEPLTVTQAAVIPGAGSPNAALRRRFNLATSNPTVNDDVSLGYDYLSGWVNTSTDTIYWLADPADGAAVWSSAASTGDMLAATYDPTTVAGDAFAMANMVEAADAKVLTAAERTKISTVPTYGSGVATALAAAVDSAGGVAIYDATAVAKLAAIEAAADVTDATNVAAAGAPIITSGAGAPSSTPSAVGDIYVDTTGDDVYQAAGTASSADWKQATGAGGGDLLAANNLSDVASAATSYANIKQAASATATGAVELATIAEVDTGTDTARAITPAGLKGSALQTKVDGIETAADVTDATNVAAAGAVMVNGSFPTASTDPGTAGDLAVSGNRMAAYIGAGWIFFEGFTI